MNRIYSLGCSTVHADEGVVRCGDDVVPLPPKAFHVLSVLLERPGEVLTKRALMDAVWGDAAVEEANLTQSIYQLRRTFRERDPAVRIETVPRLGYRLVVAPPALRTGRSGARRLFAATLAAAFLTAVPAAMWWHRSTQPSVDVPSSYALGYYYWSNAKSASDDRRAIVYFRQAIAQEPRSALGYAGLAEAYTSLAVRSIGSAQMVVDARAAFSAARTAVAVDPSSADAHAAFGQAHAVFGDPGVALRELRRATELDPTLVEARTWYGEALMVAGDGGDATKQFEAALAQDSSWTQAADDLALLAYLRRDDARAQAFARQSLEQNPHDFGATFTLALAQGRGARPAAERELRALAHVGGEGNVAVEALLCYYESEDHDWTQARVAFARAQTVIRNRGVIYDPSVIVSLAGALAAMHQSATAFAWLARVEVPIRKLFAADPRLDALHGSPSFARWLRAS
jgi:DNA-binding winged helix-turn-helix (wHTH) protein/Tfp pilus assembly protein PilF